MKLLDSTNIKLGVTDVSKLMLGSTEVLSRQQPESKVTPEYM